MIMKRLTLTVVLLIVIAGCAKIGTKINLMENAFLRNKAGPVKRKVGLIKYGYARFGDTKLEI